MITYEHNVGKNNDIAVKLDGKLSGKIVFSDGGFRYHPKGSKLVGDEFRSLAAVKASIEGRE